MDKNYRWILIIQCKHGRYVSSVHQGRPKSSDPIFLVENCGREWNSSGLLTQYGDSVMPRENANKRILKLISGPTSVTYQKWEGRPSNNEKWHWQTWDTLEANQRGIIDDVEYSLQIRMTALGVHCYRKGYVDTVKAARNWWLLA